MITSSTPNHSPVCRALVTRRRFLAAVGTGAAFAAAGPYGISLWSRRPSLAVAGSGPVDAASAAHRTIVVIEMGGGNDGLNMVVPHASGRYHDLRRDLAVVDPLDLDGEVGLHPALESVSEMWHSGRVATIEGVGYPDADLSHFASMSTWWSGIPGSIGDTGWLGRYLDRSVGTNDPLAGVTIGPGPHPAVLGNESFVVAIQDASGLVPSIPGWIDDTDELMAMWAGFAPPDPEDPALLASVRDAIGGTVEAARTINAVLAELPATDTSVSHNATNGRRRGGLVEYMALAGGLVACPVRPRVLYVHGWGDFDTHENQATRHERMMRDLDAGVAAFFAAAGFAGDDAIVMTTSEFGRRAGTNGSGTDHGTASTHLVIGAAVQGGRYGAPVDLMRLDPRGNVSHTLDYRSYYRDVLDDWLRSDAEEILDGDFEALGFIESQPSARPVHGDDTGREERSFRAV